MNDLKELKESTAELEVSMEETNWTSIDLYYKGFHIKKSFPKNMKLDLLVKSIEKAISAGFTPSWNEDTNKLMNGTKVSTPKEDLGNCDKCGAPNQKSMKGNIYCSKKCWL